MVVFSQFSDEVREAHVGSSWSLLKSQEAQIAAQARLAVGMLQRLEGRVNSVAVSELVQDLEAGKMSLSEVIERLQDAPPDEEPAEGNEDSEEKPPTMASLQAKHLASSEVNYRRRDRPKSTGEDLCHSRSQSRCSWSAAGLSAATAVRSAHMAFPLARSFLQ